MAVISWEGHADMHHRVYHVYMHASLYMPCRHVGPIQGLQ